MNTSYRGPAPLQYTIMDGSKYGGITLQTLDDKSFDHGLILAQHLYSIPNPDTIKFQELLDVAKRIGANLLVNGLRNRLFVPPLIESKLGTHDPRSKLTHARKITSRDKKVNWFDESAQVVIPRQIRALGRLWSTFHLNPQKTKRVLFEDIQKVDRPEIFWGRSKMETSTELNEMDDRTGSILEVAHTRESKPIHFAVIPTDDTEKQPLFYIEDEDAIIFLVRFGALRISRLTVEGQQPKAANKVMQGFRQNPEAWQLKSVETQEDPRHKNRRWFVEPRAKDEISEPDLEEVASTLAASRVAGSSER